MMMEDAELFLYSKSVHTYGVCTVLNSEDNFLETSQLLRVTKFGVLTHGE